MSGLQILVLIIHVIVTVGLIVVVLLQTDKAEGGIGGTFGGGASATVFGRTGAETFFSKLTTIFAIIFMVTSIALTYIVKSPAQAIPEMKSPVQATEPAQQNQ